MAGWRIRTAICAAVATSLLTTAAGAQAATFTSSNITSPTGGSELFYDFDTGSGSITVQGTVTPALTSTAAVSTTGDLLCYVPGVKPFTMATGIPISAGGFDFTVSLSSIFGQACVLRFVPHGQVPSTDTAPL